MIATCNIASYHGSFSSHNRLAIINSYAVPWFIWSSSVNKNTRVDWTEQTKSNSPNMQETTSFIWYVSDALKYHYVQNVATSNDSMHGLVIRTNPAMYRCNLVYITYG